MQSLDATDPIGDLGVSLGQSVHAVALVELKNLPAPQSVHGVDPVNALYFPAKHAVQLKDGPDEPVLQVQVVNSLEENPVLAVTPLPASVHRSWLLSNLSRLYPGDTESVRVSESVFNLNAYYRLSHMPS